MRGTTPTVIFNENHTHCLAYLCAAPPHPNWAVRSNAGANYTYTLGSLQNLPQFIHNPPSLCRHCVSSH